MSLPGSEVDSQTMKSGLVNMNKGIQVEIVEQASGADIDERVTGLKNSALASCWFYLQGHGVHPIYLPSDFSYDNGTWKGLDSGDICRILRSMDPSVWRVFMTDFCHSGNYFRLRYMLFIDETGAKWVETPEWSMHKDECFDMKAHKVPAIHFAGSTHQEEVFEGRKTGGFFTKAMVENWNQPMTLPDQLQAVRLAVTEYLETAKSNSQHFPKHATQTPQIYSSLELSLEDPEVLHKFQQGDLELPDFGYDDSTTPTE